MTGSGNPAQLQEYDTAWSVWAQATLSELRRALAGLNGAEGALYDHIGSTAVPGLLAKPIIDLQVRVLPLPSEDELKERLGRSGWIRAEGSRPDSPGVHRDIPRGAQRVPSEVWEKRLFVSEDASTILHIRRTDSPWGRYTVWFRDWLRADEDARRRYELVKRLLSAENRGKSDYDDYTRGKTVFFDEVQEAFTEWATRSGAADAAG